MQPLLVITCGIMGTGKSRLYNEVVRILHRKSSETVEIKKECSLLIDDIVNKSKKFKNHMIEIIRDIESIPANSNSNNNIIIHKLTNNISSRATTGYMNARKSPCFNNNNTCDSVLDSRFKKCIQDGNNAVFETTGSNSIKWIFDEYENMLCEKNYKIIIALMLLDIDESINRSKRRFLKNYRDTIKHIHMSKTENISNVPRLPITKRNLIKDMIFRIIKNINQIVSDPLNAISKNKTILNNTSLLIFDNNDVKMNADIPLVLNYKLINTIKSESQNIPPVSEIIKKGYSVNMQNAGASRHISNINIATRKYKRLHKNIRSLKNKRTCKHNRKK